MNNEPVAWTACLDCGQKVTDDSIHTCSPQLKTLTEDTECQYCKQGCIRCDARKLLTDEEIEELAEYHGIDSLYETGRLDFARALLRKAEEK